MSSPAVHDWMSVGEPVPLSWVQVGEPVATAPWIRVGAPTQTMLTADGYKVWVGVGEPAVVVGAAVGDLYIDSDSGMLYRLD